MSPHWLGQQDSKRKKAWQVEAGSGCEEEWAERLRGWQLVTSIAISKRDKASVEITMERATPFKSG